MPTSRYRCRSPGRAVVVLPASSCSSSYSSCGIVEVGVDPDSFYSAHQDPLKIIKDSIRPFPGSPLSIVVKKRVPRDDTAPHSKKNAEHSQRNVAQNGTRRNFPAGKRKGRSGYWGKTPRTRIGHNAPDQTKNSEVNSKLREALDMIGNNFRVYFAYDHV